MDHTKLAALIAEASNSATPATRLVAMYDQYDIDALTCALAANPTTPIELLAQMGDEYASFLDPSAYQQVLVALRENPTWPHLARRDPALRMMSVAVLADLRQSETDIFARALTVRHTIGLDDDDEE